MLPPTAALLLLPSLAWAAEPRLWLPNDPEAVAAEGLSPEVRPWEDGLRTTTGKGAFEWWYFDAKLDDGSEVVVNLLTRRIMKWKGPLNPKLEVTVTSPDGTTVQEFLFYDPATFSAATDRCDVRMGTSHAWGDLDVYHLEIRGERVSLDLVFDGDVPAWRPGTGKVYFDEDRTQYMGWVVPVPRGAVTGTVTVDGVSRPVTGVGYHDHNYGNVAMNQMMDGWLWGRGSIGPWTVLFFVGEGSKRFDHAPIPLFLLARDERFVVDDPPAVGVVSSSPMPGRERGPDVPGQVVLTAGDAEAAIALSGTRILEYESLLAGLPGPARALAGLAMDPWYIRIAADAHLDAGGESLDGTAIYEWMLFR